MSRNVVLVTIDSLRADHCGFHGYDQETTPTLDAWADSGVTFENAVAPGPKTPESMPVMFTGEPFRRDQYDLDAMEWYGLVRPHMNRHGSFVESLSAQGYETIGFSPNGFTTSHFGFDAGFRRFEDFLDDEFRPGFDLPGVVRGLFKWVRREGNWKTWEGYYDDVQRAAEAASEPYFLWVFLMDVHSPYVVPRHARSTTWPEMVYANWRATDAPDSPPIRERVVDAYDDAVRYADEFLARARDELPGDPAFVVTADHGEALGEHGNYGHERYLYEENIHVPLVVAGTDERAVIERPASLRSLPDVVETVAAGGSLQDRFEGSAHDPVVAVSGEGDRLAVRTSRFKFIRGPAGEELYDLAADAGETTGAAADYPEIAAALRSFANDYRRARHEEQHITEGARIVGESRPL